MQGRMQTYTSGKPYRRPIGRYAPHVPVVDHLDASHAVVDLDREHVSAADFEIRIMRELKIRFYQPKSRKSYAVVLSGFLRWLGREPATACREDVRAWLELLVDGGASSSWVSVHLSALRTMFDKLCGRSITLGLCTPRRPSRVPRVLSAEAVQRLLVAAPSTRDKVLLALLYATGMRVSEGSRVRFRDIDVERNTLRVVEGKGRKDRMVTLPTSLAPALAQLARLARPADWLFPSPEDPTRHISPRTAQRIMARAARLAGIDDDVGCHTLRHSFATHLLEHGVDIRFIQKLLGHMRLETTTLYTRVAIPRAGLVQSPLDLLDHSRDATALGVAVATPRALPSPSAAPTPVGSMRLRVTPRADGRSADVQVAVSDGDVVVVLDDIVLTQQRPTFFALQLPPLEAWQPKLSFLSAEAQARFDDADFYERLRDAVIARFMAAR